MYSCSWCFLVSRETSASVTSWPLHSSITLPQGRRRKVFGKFEKSKQGFQNLTLASRPRPSRRNDNSNANIHVFSYTLRFIRGAPQEDTCVYLAWTDR